MADPISGATSASTAGSTAGSWLSDISGGIGLAQQLEHGKYAQAATSAAKLGSNLGAFGGSSSAVGSFGADVANLTNIITGFQQGGVGGYTSAGVNAAALAGRVGTQAAQAGLISKGAGAVAGDIGAAAGPLAAAYSVYNFAKNWQSGATGSEALQGAETGATIGAAFGGVGALAGAVIGGAVGAISSAFGGGRADPETMGLNNYAPAYNKNPSIASTLTPAQNFQMLAGVFDAKDNSPGHSTALEQHYGRMGEAAFTNDIFSQINSAIKSGKVSPTATAAQLYSQVVNPYLTSRGMGIQTNGSQNYTTSSGTNFGPAMQAAVTNMIGQWQSGQLTGKSQIGVSGQTDAGMPAYAGHAVTTQPATQASQQTIAQQLASLIGGYPLPTTAAGYG